MAAVTAAAIGAGTAIYSARQSSKQAKEQNKLAREGIEAADPYKQYRPEMAKKLNALVEDPSSITETPEYKARLEAAARQLAAQGYTGSGNAVIEAANAGGAAYQQAFENLSMLSGAGASPGGGYGQALDAAANANDNKLSATAGVANNFTNLALQIGQKFNQPSTSTNTNTKSFTKG